MQGNQCRCDPVTTVLMLAVAVALESRLPAFPGQRLRPDTSLPRAEPRQPPRTLASPLEHSPAPSNCGESIEAVRAVIQH